MSRPWRHEERVSPSPSGPSLQAGFTPQGSVDLFDGSSRTNYLSGNVVMAADMAPDGTLWVLAHDEGGGSDLYVITPAVATVAG